MFISNKEDRQKQKIEKFKELEKDHDKEMVAMTKAAWLASRGTHYGQRGEHDEALEDFIEAISFKSDHPGAALGLAETYRQKSMFVEALSVLQTAPRQMTMYGKKIGSNGDFEFNNAFMTVYLSMNDKSKALEYAKKALAVIDEPKRKEMLQELQQIEGHTNYTVEDELMKKNLIELINSLK